MFAKAFSLKSAGQGSLLKGSHQGGQGLVEYALLLALIAIVIIVILTSIGLIVSENMYSQISNGFPP